MIYNFKLTEQAKCSQKEKYQCVQLIKQLVDFSERARREGLLCLEDEIQGIKDPFFKMGLQLVVDGTDPDCIKDIMNNKICFGGYKGKSLLQKFLITTGLLSVQAGDNPRIVQETLLSILRGIDMKYVDKAIGKEIKKSQPKIKPPVVDIKKGQKVLTQEEINALLKKISQENEE